MKAQTHPFDLKNIGNIPEELKSIPNWVIWKLIESNGKLTKVPFQSKNPDLPASTTNPKTWSTFNDAVQVFEPINFKRNPETLLYYVYLGTNRSEEILEEQ